jgi:hypothetical protein
MFDQFFIAILSIGWRMNRKVKDVTNAETYTEKSQPAQLACIK